MINFLKGLFSKKSFRLVRWVKTGYQDFDLVDVSTEEILVEIRTKSNHQFVVWDDSYNSLSFQDHYMWGRCFASLSGAEKFVTDVCEKYRSFEFQNTIGDALDLNK